MVALRDMDEPPFGFQYCRYCGGKTELVADVSPHLICTSCDKSDYFNSKPCAEALVVRQREVLLVKRTIEPYHGYWDIPGGFLELTEHPKIGAIREVSEEVGIDINIHCLLGVFLDQYDSGEMIYTLTHSYLAEPVGQPRPLSEVDAVGFFSQEVLPDKIAFSHAREVIDMAFKTYDELNRLEDR
tara:strand:+ start:6083 stop:6637 length:555 start_codon:yes stop_codon:yes gene_type:complete